MRAEFSMRLKIIIILSLFFVAVQAKEMRSANMGFLTDGMNDIKYKDARIAFSMWLEDLATKEYIDVDIMYYDSSAKIIEDFTNAKLNYIALNSIFYLNNQTIIDNAGQEFWTMHKGKKQLESYIILVRDDSSIKTLQDLKNKTVVTREGNYLGKMYLDTELLKVRHQDSTDYIATYIETAKFSTALLNTFFGKSDACIVPRYAMNIASEMNPAIKKRLRIIKESEEIFFPQLAIFHKSIEKNLINDFRLNVRTLKESARGRSILSLFKMENIRMISKEKIIPMKKYYNDYLTLRKKYVRK